MRTATDYTKEEQKILFLYFDTVLMDFDSVTEIKRIREQLKKVIKRPGNK